MTIHITDLGVEGCKGVCIYDYRMERTSPVGNGSYNKIILIKVYMYRCAWMTECLLIYNTSIMNGEEVYNRARLETRHASKIEE